MTRSSAIGVRGATGLTPATAVGVLSSFVAVVSLVGIGIADVALTRGGRPDLRLSAGGGPAFGAAVVSATAVGVVLLRTRPHHAVGWCFAGLGVSVALTGAAQSYGSWALFVHGGAPLAATAAMVASSGFIVWMVLVGLVCALTPDGLPLSRRWGWVVRALVAAGALWWLASIVTPGPLDQTPFADVENPWGVVIPGTGAVRTAAALSVGTLLVGCAASLLVRFRRSRDDERRRLLWMAVGVVPLPVIVVLMFAAAASGNDVLLDVSAGVFVALLPVCALLAITRYHLYDVERILSRAVVYLLLSAALGATYVSVVVLVGNGIGGWAGSSTLSVALATLAASLVARPMHAGLQTVMDRRFARRRYDALLTVRAHVAAPEPGESIEQVLRQALRDHQLSVAYWVIDRGQWVSGDGEDTAPAPGALIVQRAGRTVAAVTATPGSAASDVVAACVREAEPALESAGLRAAVALQLQEVRASRERIVTAQLQERRRIERDLHDGSQQRLLALAAQLQAALLNGSPERQREALRIGVEQSRVAVQELRALANGLHPAVLTDGGLGAALHDLAARLPVRVQVDEPDRRWPVQVEQTAWYVACEAVANAVKHAAARQVCVDVRRDGSALVLSVEDDGSGGADPAGPGLRGLADRVEAVGGRLHVGTGAAGGTQIEAVLPCGW